MPHIWPAIQPGDHPATATGQRILQHLRAMAPHQDITHLPATPAAASIPSARRADAGTVRLADRDIAGLLLCGEMYGAPYDLLAAFLRVRSDRARGIVARWRHAGYADIARLGPGPAWCWLTRTGLTVTGLGYTASRPALGRLAHIRAVLAVRLSLQASDAYQNGHGWWRSERRIRAAIDPQRAPVAAQIFTWRAEEKLGVPTITARLNTGTDAYPPPDPATGWTDSGVRSILRNPKYTGHMVFGRTRTTGGRARAVPLSEWLWSPEPSTRRSSPAPRSTPPRMSPRRKPAAATATSPAGMRSPAAATSCGPGSAAATAAAARHHPHIQPVLHHRPRRHVHLLRVPARRGETPSRRPRRGPPRVASPSVNTRC